MNNIRIDSTMKWQHIVQWEASGMIWNVLVISQSDTDVTPEHAERRDDTDVMTEHAECSVETGVMTKHRDNTGAMTG